MIEESEAKRVMNIRIIAAAGIVLCATGITIMVSGAQLLFLGAIGKVKWMAFWKLLLGFASMITGLFYTTQKGWASLAALVLAVVQMLYFIFWTIYALYHGFFALITVMVLSLDVLSSILILISFHHARRYHKEYLDMFHS